MKIWHNADMTFKGFLGMTVIPQALAYSQIAELPLEVRKKV